MPVVGFEPTISADERLQTYALDCVATGTDIILILHYFFFPNILCVILYYIFQSPARVVHFSCIFCLHFFLPFKAQMLKKKV